MSIGVDLVFLLHSCLIYNTIARGVKKVLKGIQLNSLIPADRLNESN